MSQADYSIADQAGAAFRAELNSHLSAIASNNSGATEPSTTFAYQWWADTTTGLLKIRNAANSDWVTVGSLATSISAFILTLLNDSSAATARATLGAAALASPAFTGTPTAPTASVSTNTTQIATTAFVMSQTANTARRGIIEVATDAEALGGTDTAKAVTSAGLASGQSLGTNGYNTLPGGLIEQWCSLDVNTDVSGSGNSYVVTFPIAFPSVVYGVAPSIYSDGSGGRNLIAVQEAVTLSQVTVRVNEISSSAQSGWGIFVRAIGK